MMCEKCGVNEANFHYAATINGNTTERRLCSACAGEEGMDEMMSVNLGGLYQEMFGGFAHGHMPRMFGPAFGQAGAFSPAFFFLAPSAVPPQPEAAAAEESESKIPSKACENLRTRREISALRHQLNAAVKAEEYEKAAQLRDKLRELENK